MTSDVPPHRTRDLPTPRLRAASDVDGGGAPPMCGKADAAVGFLARDMPGVRVRVHRAERLTSQGFYDRPQTTQRHFRQRKPCPRRVAQEGFMATPVCRQEPTDISVNPRFRRQPRQLDPPIDTMSSPYRVLRRSGGRLPARAEPASGQSGNERPLQETVRGAEARADRSIGGQSRLIPPIPPCERILLTISNQWESAAGLACKGRREAPPSGDPGLRDTVRVDEPPLRPDFP
jgi:hypothetical protein